MDDPTSTAEGGEHLGLGEFGRPVDNNAGEFSRPVDNNAALIESLRKAKAELETEVHTATAQLEEVTTKLLHSQSINAKTREEFDGIARQYEERVRLFRELQVSYDDLLRRQSNVDADCVNLKRERDDKDILIKRVNKEKQLIAVEVHSLKSQLKDLEVQKRDLEMQRRMMEKSQQDAKLEMQRAADEKAVYDESRKWYMTELAERDNRIAQMRLELGGREVSWQNERMRIVGEKSAAVGEMEDVKADVALKQRLLDEVNEKLRGITDTHENQLSLLKGEMSTKEVLIQALRDQVTRADEAATQLKEHLDSTSALLNSANEEVTLVKEESTQQMEENARIMEEKDKELAELKDELEKANELLKNKHNFSITDEAIDELSPAAAAASRLMKSGGSLTAIYREHAKLVASLEEERARSRIAEESFQEVIGQLTERAPQLIQQKEQLEKYMDENYRLDNQLREADDQRRKLMEERDLANRELAFSKAELQKEQQQKNHLANCINGLYFELERARELEEKMGWNQTPLDANSDENARKIKDIRSLSKRNLELEMELTEEKEKAHHKAEQLVQEATERLERDREEMQRELDMQKDHSAKLTTALEARQQAVESYKKIVEGGLGGENTITKRQLDAKTSELNDALARMARLEEWRSNDQEEKKELIRVYEDRISQHIEIVSEVKRSHAKAESDLDLQKQTASETYKELEKKTRQMEKTMEAEQKAREQVIALEQKVFGLHERLMEMQAELSTLGVQKRHVDELYQSALVMESRLKSELDIRTHNSLHNETMLAMMEEMKSRVHAVETTKKEVMEMRVESLENERDQLRTSNAALAERNERLEKERGADVARMNAEKMDLEAKLQIEKNERISSENMANEMREKLISSQKLFTAVDMSIGSDPERLAQECQKLKNEHKFMEGQVEELKKRADVANTAAKKAEEELLKMTKLSSTVELTLKDTKIAESLEKDRLQGLLEAEVMKATNLSAEVDRLREYIETIEKAAGEAKITADSTFLELSQKMAVLEMHLREETAKGIGFDERMKGFVDEKNEAYNQMNALNDELQGVKGEMEEMKIEKMNMEGRMNEIVTAREEMETRIMQDSTAWMDEKLRLEGEVRRLEMEAEMEKRRLEEEIGRKEAQLNELITSVREMDGGGEGMEEAVTDREAVAQMSAVNRYLREEQQRTMERMMRAEVEMKRAKVQNDELEGERVRMEKKIAEMQMKGESDAAALRDMAELKMKLEIAIGMEKELGGVKMEKEKITKEKNELIKKLNLLAAEKTKLVTEKDNSIGEKMREVMALKKTIGEKEMEMNKMRAELATTKKAVEGVGMGGGVRGAAVLNQLKAAKDELAEAQKKLEAQTALSAKQLTAEKDKSTKLRVLALKYKALIDGGETSANPAEGAIEGEAGMPTPPSAVSLKKLQLEKDELNAKLEEVKREKEMIESERDEIQFRLKSINSMMEKANNQKGILARQNAELKKRLEELGIIIETESLPSSQPSSQPTSAMSSPFKTSSSTSISQPISTLVSSLPPPAVPTSATSTTSATPVSSSISFAAAAAAAAEAAAPSTSTSLVVPPAPTTSATSSPFKQIPAVSPQKPVHSIESESGEVVTSAAPSDPAPPTTSTSNIFGAANIEWPGQMSRSVASSSTGLASSGLLFGRSKMRTPHVSTSSHPEESSSKVEEEDQPITSSSSGENRKRGAIDDMMEMKRARREEEDEEEEGGNDDVITSSHRGEELDELMMEDDTRDGEDDGMKRGEEAKREDEEDEESREVIDEEEVVVDDEEEEEEDEDEEEEERDEEDDDDEDDNDDDDDNDDPDDDIVAISDGDDDEDVAVVEREEGVDEEEEGEIDGRDEEEGDGGGDDEVDRGSESDGEVEGGLMEKDEGREAVASIDEADEEEGSPDGGEEIGEEGGEGIPAIDGDDKKTKKKSPIRWEGTEEAECSSSNETGRPSTSAAAVEGVSPRGAAMTGRGMNRSNRGGMRRNPIDLATNILRMNRGGRGGGGKRGGGGGSGVQRM